MKHLGLSVVLVFSLNMVVNAMQIPSLKELAEKCLIAHFHSYMLTVPENQISSKLESMPAELKDELFDLLRASCEKFCWRYCAEHKDFKGDTEAVTALTFGNNGTTLFVGRNNGKVETWDIERGKQLESFIAHPQARINALIITKDDSLIITGAADKSVKVWERHTKELLKEFVHSSKVWSIAFEESESLLLTGCFDNKAYLWDISKGKCPAVLSGHTKKVYAVAFGPTKNTLVTAARDESCSFKICVWDRQTGTLIDTVCSLPSRGFNSCVVTSDGTYALENNGLDTLYKWDITKRTCEDFMPYNSLSPLAIASSDEYIVAKDYKNEKDVLSIHTLQGTFIKHLEELHKGFMYSVAMSRKNTAIATGFSDGLLQVWTCNSTYDSLNSVYKRLLIVGLMRWLERMFLLFRPNKSTTLAVEEDFEKGQAEAPV
jgi:WD40 repeat protein